MSAGLQWFLLALAGIVAMVVLFRLFTGDGGDASPGLSALALLPAGSTIAALTG